MLYSNINSNSRSTSSKSIVFDHLSSSYYIEPVVNQGSHRYRALEGYWSIVGTVQGTDIQEFRKTPVYCQEVECQGEGRLP